MAVCCKCNTENEEGLTRCKQCNAIMPVKLGSKSEVRYERTRRAPDLVGTKCPKCETINPYTRFRCIKCNALLSKKAVKSSRLEKLWLYVGVGVAVVATAVAVLMKGM